MHFNLDFNVSRYLLNRLGRLFLKKLFCRVEKQIRRLAVHLKSEGIVNYTRKSFFVLMRKNIVWLSVLQH